MFTRVPVSADLELLEQWERASLATVWTGSAEEWHVPAVDAVAQTLTRPIRSHRLAAACRRLGESRATAMVDLEETRDDLQTVARLGDQWRTATMLDNVTVGWVDAMSQLWSLGELLDPDDGFHSLGYLTSRLDEVYAEARLTGQDVSRDWALIVLDTRPRGNGMARYLVHETLHSALRFAFIGGESRVTVRDGRLAALVGRAEPRLSDSLAVLRSELARALESGQLGTVRTRLVGLPSERRDLAPVLQDLTA